MKRFVLVLLLSIIGLVSNAQFHHHHHHHSLHHHTSMLDVVRAVDEYHLSTILFDESKLQENPEVWARYQNYLAANETARLKSKPYVTTSWVGLGCMAASMIPLCVAESDAAFVLGTGLLTVGSVVAMVGCVGYSLQISKMKYNKREFIYYLRTTNNGVGIVSLF